MTPPSLANRSLLRSAARIVIKVGSSSLTLPDGSLNSRRVSQLAQQIAAIRAGGQEVVLVTSGAVAAGIRPLGLRNRPKDLVTQQAAAMVGQVQLVSRYAKEFSNHQVNVAQALLTVEDVWRRENYANAQSSLNRLLTMGIVPIVNENDAVATGELRFGDNDRLAALTALLVGADAMVLLTDVNGLYTAPPTRANARRISEVHSISELEKVIVTRRGSSVGTGGMVTKIDAARIATHNGIPALLAHADDLAIAIQGADVGTWFPATGPRRPARRAWLGYVAESLGTVIVDQGAKEALCTKGSSLLSVGVRRVDGKFHAGDVISVADDAGHVFAKGIAGFSHTKIKEHVRFYDSVRASGSPAGSEGKSAHPVVHRDDLALV